MLTILLVGKVFYVRAEPLCYVDNASNALNNPMLPSGGTAGQFLTKSSNVNYEAGWTTVPAANGVSF
jgi:hypothetical protein